MSIRFSIANRLRSSTPLVHAALGWPPPAVSEDSIDDDPKLAEIRMGWERLTGADQESYPKRG